MQKFFLIICLIFSSTLFGQEPSHRQTGLKVFSPDSTISVTFILNDGEAFYKVSRFGIDLIKESKLGFVLRTSNAEIKDQSFDKNFTLISNEIKSFDETWTQVWGEKKDIRNNYNELSVNLSENNSPSKKLNIIFRVFDDGVGFRYKFPEQEGLKKFEIMDELTEFNMTENHNCWWIGAYQWNRYEFLFENTPLTEIDTVHTPFTMKTKDGIYLSIHEAALLDYASMTIERTDSLKLKANLVPWSDGVKVKTEAPMKTPWRTIQIADTPGELITSYLILNLNEPNKIEDISWIKPAKYMGIWWEMHIGPATWGSGENHGATTEKTKKYMDFASKYGFDGVLVEGWNEGWDGDWVANGEIFSFTTPYPDFDIEEIVKYGKEKNVQLIGHHETGASVLNYEKQLEDAFDFYERLGVHYVKTGYVGHGQTVKRIDENGNVQREWHHGQFMVRHYHKVIEEAAKHKIMIDAHEPIKDTGERRTWPNMMTREGARGQEYNAWGSEGGNPPSYTTTIPFTRCLAGPFDYTPGVISILYEDPPPVDNRVLATIAKELAHYVIIYSPLQMAADLPENYEKNLDAFQFIVDVPADWEDTKVLNASIGNYVTIARKDRNGSDWYLGSITDENGRVLEVKLDFLEPGKKYTAEIYRDGKNADWISNPLDLEIIEEEVDSNTTLTLRLAPGGGQAIRFR